MVVPEIFELNTVTTPNNNLQPYNLAYAHVAPVLHSVPLYAVFPKAFYFSTLQPK